MFSKPERIYILVIKIANFWLSFSVLTIKLSC